MIFLIGLNQLVAHEVALVMKIMIQLWAIPAPLCLSTNTFCSIPETGVLLSFLLSSPFCCPRRFAVLAVLDFQIPCFRPETPALYPRSLLTNNEGRGQNENVRADFEGGNEGFKDPDQWGRRRPEEPCLNQQITILNYGPDKLL